MSEDIYYDDLNEKGKEKIKREANIDDPKELNADVFPLFMYMVEPVGWDKNSEEKE